MPATPGVLLERMTGLITRGGFNVAALGALLLVAICFGVRLAWAGETQDAPPFQSEATQASEPSPNERCTDRPIEQRIGPLAHRLHEIIFVYDSRLSVPQSSVHLDHLLHVPER
jgi:hypothetical protein